MAANVEKSPLIRLVDELYFKQIRRKIARVKFAEELGTMSKNRLRWITLVRGPIWGIHSLTLMISYASLVHKRLMFYCNLLKACV